MSIWASVDQGEDVRGVSIKDVTDTNWDPAKREPDMLVDVATATGWTDYVRLSIDPENAWGAEVLLSPSGLYKLKTQIDRAISKVGAEWRP